MPLTLHAAFVPSCQQVLGGMMAMIDKAESFARDQGIDDSELLEAKLADTMWSLPWHVSGDWCGHGRRCWPPLARQSLNRCRQAPGTWKAWRRPAYRWRDQ